jgi:mRNA deadenylase 3'-5' endonuclease subunit Ccr4
MDKAPGVVVVGGQSPGQMRVTTYNLLAPVWVHESYYPGMPVALFDPAARRATIKRRILEMDSDVLCLEECQKTELDAMLSADNNELATKYEVEFCPYPGGCD